MKRILVAVAGLVLVLPVFAAFGIPGATATSEAMFVEVAHADTDCLNGLGDSDSNGYADPCTDGGNVNVVAPPRDPCENVKRSWWQGLWRRVVWVFTGYYFC